MNFRTALVLILLMALFGCTRQKSISNEYPAEVSALATEGGSGLPYFIGKDLRPVWKTQEKSQIRSLNSFRLKDQKGKEISSDKIHGKVTIVSFFYSQCPGICPMTTKNLKPIQEKFKDNERFEMLSFSVTPQSDTPARLTQFAKKHDISYRRWKLITGNRDQIYRIARESFGADTFSEKENQIQKLKPEDFLHSENVYLLDGEQKLRGIYSGLQVSSIQELARDAETLLQ